MVYCSALERILGTLIPHSCTLCRGYCQGMDLCQPCRAALPWMDSACKRCGLPCAEPLPRCGNCLQSPPLFDHCAAAFHYADPIKGLILRFKQSQQLSAGRVLEQLAADFFREHYRHHAMPQALIAVPCHTSKLRQRGFNQSQMLARTISRSLQLPLIQGAITSQDSSDQKHLRLNQRRQNRQHSFELTGNTLAGSWRHVGIVDDIVTSGATANALASCLRESGVEQIDVLSLARTDKHH